MMPLVLSGLRLRTLWIATALALLLAGMGSWTRPPDPDLVRADGTEGVEIWVLDNGFHTDLAVPRAALEARAGPLGDAVRALPSSDWVLVGWGDARFYVDTRPIGSRLPDGARAFFRPGNPSVVMLDPSDANPATAYAPGVAHPIHLSRRGFSGLTDRLEASLAIRDGSVVAGPPAERRDARFFHSVETFWIGHLCNHWAGELLHAGGLPLRPVRSIVSAEIVRMAQRSQDTGRPALNAGSE